MCCWLHINHDGGQGSPNTSNQVIYVDDAPNPFLVSF